MTELERLRQILGVMDPMGVLPSWLCAIDLAAVERVVNELAYEKQRLKRCCELAGKGTDPDSLQDAIRGMHTKLQNLIKPTANSHLPTAAY